MSPLCEIGTGILKKVWIEEPFFILLSKQKGAENYSLHLFAFISNMWYATIFYNMQKYFHFPSLK
jgi:hypothetical protein